MRRGSSALPSDSDFRGHYSGGGVLALSGVLMGALCLVGAGALAASGKTVLDASLQQRAEQYWQAARQIWDWAEPGYQEVKSSGLLAEILSEEGFRVERGVAEMPTAFVASYGSGKPVIGILAEFDALPGLAQEAAPREQARAGSTYGHACGHHLFGVGSVAAAIALADAIRAGELEGTVRLYGTPAEEGGGAKVFMVTFEYARDHVWEEAVGPPRLDGPAVGVSSGRGASYPREHAVPGERRSIRRPGRGPRAGIMLTG